MRTRSDHRRGGRGAGLAALAALALGCGGEGSTEPSSSPARLVALSSAIDTVVAGERADPPVSVQVLDDRGRPVEGIPIRFLLLTEGAGRLDGVSVSDRQGRAEADFQAGREAVEAGIRVDVPSAGRVAPLGFRLVVVPAASVSLAVLGGDGQEAEVGSQLPLPFEVRATTPGGAPAGGVAIAWRVEGEAAGARLTADTAFTDEEGRARSVLTLGERAGELTVAVHATGGVASDTARIRVRALEGPTGSVRLDSVRPLPLVAGDEATAFGAGLAPAGGEVEVRVEGEAGSVLGTEEDRVRFVVPPFADRCLPAREVGLRLLAAGEASNGAMVPLTAREPALELGVGEARTLTGEALGCLQLPGARGERAYLLAVGSASRTAGARTAVRLIARAGDDPDRTEPAASVVPRGLAPELRREAREGHRAELALRAAVRREILGRRLRPARPAARDPELLRAPGGARGPPAPGDTVTFRFAVGPDLAATCANTTNRVTGLVRGAGDHHILVTDLQTPDGGFAPEEWQALGEEFDRLAFPTDTAYFGSPADLDGNGRVVLLFTPEVNALTPPGSGIFIGGFFLALDLADSGRGEGVSPPGAGTCPASNEAEILYLAVPDPEGRFGDPLTVAQARRTVRELFPHELQHLINAERRVLVAESGFDALEETWLDEGLSHVAEEVAGLELLGLGRGLNLRFDDVTGTRTALDAFNAFHIQNFFNLGLFLLDPAGSPTVAAADPGGLGSLQMRGFAWGLLRWAADHEGGADERALFRSLAGGGPSHLTGIVNLERALGEGWETVLADYLGALALDDAEPEAVAERLRVTTWNLRDVYAALHANPASRRRFPLPFPLAAAPLGFESSALDFDLNASSAQYLTLRSGREAPPLSLALRSRGGGPVSASAVPQLTIVRTR